MIPSDENLAAHDVLVPSDNAFQRVARLRQALWRESRGLPVGVHRGRPLGSRLAMPFAKDALANYLSDTIRNVVRAEVLDATRSAGKLYRQPRIFEDLLSSQPLCFNLFGELQRDLELASRTLALLLGEEGVRVSSVDFEHSPGRGDPRFTEDSSAFDVFVTYLTRSNKRGFVGIEVKYVENLAGTPARHRSRYDEVADAMGVFVASRRERLRVAPLEQLWRDHLLAGSLSLDERSGFDRGTFAVVYPSENGLVRDAVDAYRGCLSDTASFTAWTLEAVLAAVTSASAGTWASDVRERYIE